MLQYELRPLSVRDAEVLYPFMQSIPREENGFMNGAS